MKDSSTRPTLGFPASMQPICSAFHDGGARANGAPLTPSPFILQHGEKPC